jgi:hypothetical protein
LKIYQVKLNDFDAVVVMPGDECKGSFVPQLSRSMLSQMTGKIRSVKSMGELYRTKYPDQDGLALKSGNTLPLKVHHTTHLTQQRRDFLTAKVGDPAHFMCPLTGFGGSLVMYAEMHGLEAIHVTAITESHSITTEAL